MTTYSCDKMRPIKHGTEFTRRDRRGEIDSWRIVESIKDAAFMFADRIARKEYGRHRGYCHHVRCDGASTDGRYANYEAFIGHTVSGGMTSGRNIRLSVYIDPPPEDARSLLG